MKRFNYNIIFVIILCFIASLMILPPIFKLANRIEPWILGLPFAVFYIVFLCLSMSVVMIIWHYVDTKKGNVDVDIEKATEEEMKSWKGDE